MNRDDPYTAEPLARWFKPAAIATTLWMMLGCAAYLMDVSTDPATLPADQQAMMAGAPLWYKFAYGTAVWVGLAGAILLLLRRRLAETLLLISFLAAAVMVAAFFIVPAFRDNMSSDQLLLPIIVVVLGWTIYWFARHSRQRGWLN